MPSLKNLDTVREIATGYLRDAVGNQEAEFHDGQWESIEQAVSGNRVLVVQRTGWGKDDGLYDCNQAQTGARGGPFTHDFSPPGIDA